VRSMTGFGRGAVEEGEVRFAATVQSWNHRHVDLQIRLPEDLRELESEARARIQAAIARGRVELQLRREAGQESGAPTFVLDGAGVEGLLAAAEPWIARGVISAQWTLGELGRSPFVVRREAVPAVGPGERLAALAAIDRALEELAVDRTREGAAALATLESAARELATLVAELRASRADWVSRVESKLRERLAELLPGGASELPPERLAQEVVLLAERSDVAEELDRLESHLAAFGEVLAGPGPHGRRLEFWSQEVLRELNTLGSKAREASVTALIVEAKVINERIREQVQNVE